MATMAKPVEEPRRPNIATADVQLPAVRDYEQVDREIIRTLIAHRSRVMTSR